MKHIFNLRRDPADDRDFLHVEPPSTTPLPALKDMRPQSPPIYNQKALGSCTGNCYAGIADILHFLLFAAFFGPSRLFIYWYERFLEGTVNSDSGASMRDGAKVLAKWGVCSEATWPYDIDTFTTMPSTTAIAEAVNHRVITYARVAQSLNQMKRVLAGDRPIAIGIAVYDSFESDDVAKTGLVPMPNTRKEQLLGWHAVAVVGYDDARQCFIVRNSWGEEWGDKGYCYLPFNYVLNPNLANDFWVLKRTK